MVRSTRSDGVRDGAAGRRCARRDMDAAGEMLLDALLELRRSEVWVYLRFARPQIVRQADVARVDTA